MTIPSGMITKLGCGAQMQKCEYGVGPIRGQRSRKRGFPRAILRLSPSCHGEQDGKSFFKSKYILNSGLAPIS